MPTRLTQPNAFGGTTDHCDLVSGLRARAAAVDSSPDKVTLNLAADLPEAHDETGISLDDWP